jgi:hypothetical protein
MDVIKSERDAWMVKIMAAIRSVRRDTMLATATCNAEVMAAPTAETTLLSTPRSA